jgi:nicotinamidase-related amidase
MRKSENFLLNDLRRIVLLLVGMQRAFDTPDLPQRWNDNLERNDRRLLAHWRDAWRPIVYT